MARKKKDPAGAAAQPGKKEKKKKGKGGAQPAPPPPQRAAPGERRPRQRASGGVPPPEAFDNLPRRQPPNLPQRGVAQRGGPAQGAAADGHKLKAIVLPLGPAPLPQDAPEEGKRKKSRSQKTVNPAKRRRNRRVAAAAGIVLLVGVAVWLSVTMLFKIDKFELRGDSPYTVEELAEAFGHAPGDSMYGFSAGGAAQRIQEQLPYVESVEVRRRLPSTIQFRVTAAQEAYCLQTGSGFAVLSTSLKVLRFAEAQPEGLTLLKGLDQIEAELGHTLAFIEQDVKKLPGGDSSAAQADSSTGGDSSAEGSTPEDGSGEEGDGPEEQPGAVQQLPDATSYLAAKERYDNLLLMLQVLEATTLEGLDWVDVSDPLDLAFRWDGRITVRLGAKSGVEEKMKVVVVLLTDTTQANLIGPQDRGVLDMGLYFTTGEAVFSQE